MALMRSLRQVNSLYYRHPRAVSYFWPDSSVDPEAIEQYSRASPRPFTCRAALRLTSPVSTETLLQNAEYVRTELPVRLARSIKAFQALPYIVGINPHVVDILQKFCRAFDVLRRTPPITDLDEERHFNTTLTAAFKETSDVVTRMSMGIKEIRSLPPSLNINHPYLNSFIDNFLVQRISRRVLAEHHMSLHTPRADWVGVFNAKTSPGETIHRMMRVAQDSCTALYGACPSYCVLGDAETTLPYIPSHLEYILLELCKNALRASMEVSPRGRGPPEVRIRVCAGREVAIIIQDRGGGLDADAVKGVWGYGYTTYRSRPPGSPWTDYNSQDAQKDAFAGYGFGLPTCRVYARYLGGNLDLVSMAGHGTDVYVRLKPLDANCDGQLL